MLKTLSIAISVLLTGAGTSMGQLQRENCRTTGPKLSIEQNSQIALETLMDENGCRYSYSLETTHGRNFTRAPQILEKAVIMRPPSNGKLSQEGDFLFFYRPNKGFRGKDTFILYLCGSTASGSGCSRLAYNATVR